MVLYFQYYYTLLDYKANLLQSNDSITNHERGLKIYNVQRIYNVAFAKCKPTTEHIADVLSSAPDYYEYIACIVYELMHVTKIRMITILLLGP